MIAPPKPLLFLPPRPLYLAQERSDAPPAQSSCSTMSLPYDCKQSAVLAFAGLGAVLGAALGALIAGPGSGFMGAIPGAISVSLCGALIGLWFNRKT